MLIRPARTEDLPRIAEVEEAAFSTPWSLHSFRALLPVDRVLFRVLEVEGVVLGHGVLWRVGDEGEVANIAVHPLARRRGFGSRLLEHLLGEAAAAGVHRVFLDVRPSNLAAIRIYRRRGFRPVGRRTNYYREPVEDALVLRLDLGEPDADAEPAADAEPDADAEPPADTDTDPTLPSPNPRI
ncbi:MAG: ribosomal-protein-alanine N-acetyltransferase [Gemmatimonadales bacterium]|nr:MAG: ribosomal-protein-alanine N-acetyltransferase [Gemmatimonadales bacterium]